MKMLLWMGVGLTDLLLVVSLLYGLWLGSHQPVHATAMLLYAAIAVATTGVSMLTALAGLVSAHKAG